MAQQLYLKTEINKSSAQVDGARQLWKINHTRLQVTRSPEAPRLPSHAPPGPPRPPRSVERRTREILLPAPSAAAGRCAGAAVPHQRHWSPEDGVRACVCAPVRAPPEWASDRGEEGARCPAAQLLSGRRGSSQPRAARRPQPRPGHVSLPPPPACRGSGPAAFRERRGSASGARGLGPGQGAWEGSLGLGLRSREHPPPEDPRETPTRGAGSGRSPEEARSPGRRQQGDPCREGQEGERPGAPWRLRGPPACSRVAGAFLELGARRLSASHAVTAGDVSASPRAEGTRGGAGFWASRELCPLSCSKKPNQKANLQASKPNVTLSAGRERAARYDKPRIFVPARPGGIFQTASRQPWGIRVCTSSAESPEDRMRTEPLACGHPPNQLSLSFSQPKSNNSL
ncbi:basic salivary proline-rich protein 3-like [Manis pentadactyla]|uniref:basic salivary proline-rich protein 3-like n=1 Tax=Manis pentadactyla TaxID=143292 RepID=UPI00255D0407|nr:basic salivary proline-rich protein 3-like [Manis pentadactyla]